jgi:hypothetical protein
MAVRGSGFVATDDEVARRLVAADDLRAALPRGSGDRVMGERTSVVLNARIRQSLGTVHRVGQGDSCQAWRDAKRREEHMSLERELRDTSDSLLRALDRMNDMESEKRSIPTGSPRFLELASRVEDLAVEVLRRTERQMSLAEDTHERRLAGGGVGRPVEAIPAAPRDLALILSEWRDAERELADANPASAEASIAAANVRRLREEYRLAHERLLSEHQESGGA